MKHLPRLRSYLFLSVLMSLLCLTACKKFIDIPPPPTQIVSSKVFASDQSANLALVGLYSDMMNGFGPLNGFITKSCVLYGDDCIRPVNTGVDTVYQLSSIPKEDVQLWQSWIQLYSYIGTANSIIEGLRASSGVTEKSRSMLTGEARFIRALNYFYLINLYGDVPLVLVTDPGQTATQPRTPVSQVYQQIISDLLYAQAMLPGFYENTDTSASGRKRATQWAATALLARVYAYQSDWANANIQASVVIDSGPFALTTNLTTTFLPKSNETILQFQPNGNSYNTGDAGIFLAPFSSTKPPPFILTTGLLGSFEKNDARKTAWVKDTIINGQHYYIPYKYKVYIGGPPYTEYNIVLRLAEQCLIRAEACARLGKLNEALVWLNNIRRRAGLAPLSSSLTQQQLLQAVEQERRVEFFAEFGHRWFDLRRNPSTKGSGGGTRADDILAVLKPATWQHFKLYWPVPATEIKRNQYLVQNPGY